MGHEVIRYTRHNDDIKQMNKLGLAGKTLWNRHTYSEVRELIQRERPSILHCTNTFPLISPAIYYAAKKERVPVVQSLHNYRLICPTGQFLRDGRVCENCMGKTLPLPAVYHKCYKNSMTGSAVVAAMLAYHRMLKTFDKVVDVFIALTDFARDKFIEGGIPSDKITVKPNFLEEDPGQGTGSGGYAVFVGRLSPEKGIDVLIDAWAQLDRPLKLKIAGDGPLAGRVRMAAEADSRIEWLGRLKPDEVLQQLADAACLVLPSIWYEGLPRTIVESYAVGTPVIASKIGSMTELISPTRTGFHFKAGNAGDLKRTIEHFLAMPEQETLRSSTRDAFERQYMAPANYKQLMSIYARAMAKNG